MITVTLDHAEIDKALKQYVERETGLYVSRVAVGMNQFKLPEASLHAKVRATVPVAEDEPADDTDQAAGR